MEPFLSSNEALTSSLRTQLIEARHVQEKNAVTREMELRPAFKSGTREFEIFQLSAKELAIFQSYVPSRHALLAQGIELAWPAKDGLVYFPHSTTASLLNILSAEREIMFFKSSETYEGIIIQRHSLTAKGSGGN